MEECEGENATLNRRLGHYCEKRELSASRASGLEPAMSLSVKGFLPGI